MLADCSLTIISYHLFDYSNYNPYTIWVFDNLHWSVWVLEKIIVTALVYFALKRLHWSARALTYLLLILIMFGTVLYDIDSIWRTHIYSGYLGLFRPIVTLPGISWIYSNLWGLYG
jgi:hypothetical protein